MCITGFMYYPLVLDRHKLGYWREGCIELYYFLSLIFSEDCFLHVFLILVVHAFYCSIICVYTIFI